MRKVQILKFAILSETLLIILFTSFYLYGSFTENSLAVSSSQTKDKEYIKWVDFNVSCEALDKAYCYDVESHTSDMPLNWIELLSYLGAKYGGDFSNFKESDLDSLVEKLQSKEHTMDSLTKDMKYYPYYLEAYSAVLGGFVGEYEIEEDEGIGAEGSAFKKNYGLKAFSPVAKGFEYSDYDDFGVSRSYGYKRQHLGHDMMGQIGTPIII